jgi:AAA domain
MTIEYLASYQNSFEMSIISNLIYNEEYQKKVLPYIKAEYFASAELKWTFKLISAYTTRYNKSPTPRTLLIDLSERSDVNEQQCRDTAQFLEQLQEPPEMELQWLIDSTEKWCRHRAMFSGLEKSIVIFDDHKTGKENADLASIIPMLQDALGVSFNEESMDVVDHIENYKPPKYLIENLFELGNVYSITGLAGSGKTTMASLLALIVATNAHLGERMVRGGQVVYFAGRMM